jgi:hypothetical protein
VLWVGYQLWSDYKLSLEESTSRGIEFINKLNDGRPIYLFEFKDSPSLKGAFEVLKYTDNTILVKNQLYRNLTDYQKPYRHGIRWFGECEDTGYAIPDIMEYADRLRLSGTNWLNTLYGIQMEPEQHKFIDITGLFGYGGAESLSFGQDVTIDYDKHRERCALELTALMDKFDILTLDKGERLARNHYEQTAGASKIVISPHGMGAVNPKDIIALSKGQLVIKPEIEYILDQPNYYIPGLTYIPCKNDFSDLDEVIGNTLENYDELRNKMIYPAFQHFKNVYHPTHLIEWTKKNLLGTKE